MPGLRVPTGGYKPPEGKLLQLGPHLVCITEIKQQNVKSSGNMSIEIHVGNEEGTLTDWCAITDGQLFKLMQYVAATGPKPRNPQDISEAEWEGWLKGFSYLETPLDVDRLCDSLEKRDRPFWINVINQKDQKGNDRLVIDVMSKEKSIHMATDTEILQFKPYVKDSEEAGASIEEAPAPSFL